ncbi:MAG: hypothetical protein KME11_18830 [Timaviella obliquedivisa GSE-PSE-MK23-08B]|jgi:hypothetical protein|nr:hypothetical protein [Timaviella obliquedivisa GSE-PSE-MK23-08B]
MPHLAALAKFTHPVSLLLAGIVSSVLVAEAMPAATSETLMQLTRPNTEEVPEVNGAAVLAIAALGSAGVGVALTALHERNRPSTKRTSNSRFSIPSSSARANPKLQRKLLRLLHEDARVADRLITQASFRYPGKAPDWYVEKVIYDLERDRH